MKSFLTTFFLLLSVCGFSQTVIEAEYFWDTDPGNGNGIPLQALDGNFNQALETVFENDANLPALGNHTIGIRVKGQNGVWGSVYRKVVRISARNNSNALVKITQGEYFWDNDPGQGNGIALLAFDGNFNQAMEGIFTNAATLPSIGNHTIGIRVKADDGQWGATYRRVIRIVGNNNTNTSVKVTQGEYFWDNDPGAGNGIALLAFDGNFNQALESIFTNAATLPNIGDHIIGIRVKADDGNWGATFRKVFRASENNNTNNSVRITQAEYFWDNDPGAGNGTALLAFDGNFNQAMESIMTNTATLPNTGNHTIGIRVKADDDNWGTTFRKIFCVSENNNSNSSVKITQAEYFWNTDPGTGNGNPLLAFDGNFNQAIESILANNAPLPPAGLNILNLRTKAADGNWSNVYSKVVGLDITFDNQVLLSSPVNGATLVPLNTDLVWQTLTGAGTYEYQCATEASFTNIVQTGLVNATSLTLNGLAGQTTYYWRVRANVNGNVSLWSAVWSFTTTSSLSNLEFEIGADVALSPNPVQRLLTINTKLNLVKIEVLDLLGKKVNTLETSNHEIDVSKLDSGVYVLHIQDNQGQFFISKFIKK